ncbi:pentatricopeptide repeat-containing protein At5g39980, chloroplastic [Phoenix dactylifera]|uniref:Pentatricopeptide repeat-containing protein At5g39980, chloroplastic n=1 Tax=Phoenix dactylifera TaxID=42345 RepID=A0A8B7CRR4_PHODC|nr:pentatricopeptide repeat-containing protein At5g39980, chloroplastic [Phoenix dactylifera]
MPDKATAILLPQPTSFLSSPCHPSSRPVKPTLTWNSIVAASTHPILSSTGGGRGGGRDVWRRTPRNQHYVDRSVDMDALLLALSQTTTPEELHAVMSPYLGTPDGRHQLSPRFMVSLLSREPDWRRSLALLDWMLDVASYPPSIFAFNVVLRNALRARQFTLALGLLHEMRLSLSLSPDAVTYSTLVSALGQAGHLDAALSLLPLLDADGVSPDLPLLTTLIDLARKLGDHSKALSLFSRLRRARVPPDLIAFNSALAAFASAGLLRDARRLLFDEMPAAGVAPDAVSYSTLLAALVRRRRYLEALSLFSDMRARRSPLDLTTCNVMLDAYGQLDMAREADRLFWSMGRLGLPPSVVSYNTMLRVYGDAELFGEAIHLFRLMQRKEIEQNVVTYNTMIRIYGKSLEHEKAGNLVQEMQRKGIHPNAITYSTIISIWGRAGKLFRAAKLFQKLRSSGVEIDPVLYQTMIAVYERAGLVGHAKRLLHDLKHPENIPKGTAIKILASAGRVEEAAWVFRQAVGAGEVKDISVFRSMMDLFSRNRKHKNVIEVFEKMRGQGYFPDSEMIAIILNAYGKLQEFDRAAALYQEMQEEGCVFTDRVHFQMLSLLGGRRDFKGLEALLERLRDDPDIDKKELHLVAAGIYERANKLDEASKIIAQIKNSNAVAFI